MPTLPPEEPRPEDPPAGRSLAEPHLARHVAESFGTGADRYDRARPRYPAALVDAIVAASPGPDLLDVGCGTGIASRQFRAAGCRVLGVDVDARMAEVAERSGIPVELAAFEAWGPAGRSFDAVVAGQAWHWVDPVAGAAKAVAVLRPGGRLAAFWNVFDTPPEMAGPFAAAYRRALPELPVFQRAMPGLAAYAPILEKADDGMRATTGLSEPERWTFDWQRTYTKDEWTDQVPTFGGHDQIPPAKLTQLLDDIGAAIDAVGGTFTMRYTGVVVTAVRSAPG